jgi:hypothetical protein
MKLDEAFKYIENGMAETRTLYSTLPIADGYYRKRIVLEREKQIDSTMVCFRNSLRLNESINHDLGTSYSLDNIAGIYRIKNET